MKIILIYGNIGTGKTTLAKNLASKLSYELVCFDEEIKFLYENPYDDKGILKLELDEILEVYKSMLNKTKELLKQGKNVVLESMYFTQQREEVKQFAKENNIQIQVVEVTCQRDVVEKRIEERKKINPQSPGFENYDMYKDYIGEESSDHIKLDTTVKDESEITEECIKNILKSSIR